MIRIRPPAELPWLEGRFWDVPHQLGPDVAIARVDLSLMGTVPSDAVTESDRLRAARIHDRVEAQLFLASQAVLRGLLADMVGESPLRLTLTIGKHGKPRLAGGALRFNTSRSGAAVLIGVSESRDIGVDIERVSPVPDLQHLARASLTAREYQAWRDSASSQVDYLCSWTRKEACVKAAGFGLSLPMRCVDVGCEADAAPRSVDLCHGRDVVRAQVVSLPMPPEYVAAAAVIAY